MTMRNRLITTVTAACALAAALTACSAESGGTPARAASPTACPREAAPTAPPHGGGGGTAKGGAVPVAKTVKPTDTRTSTVVEATGPQIRCGRTGLSSHQDIVYAAPVTRGRKTELKLDLQVPEGAGAKPLVVYIPGGGFVLADRKANLAQRTYVAEQGYAVASITYRTSADGATYRDGVADVKSAVRFLRAHADQYGFDAAKVAVWGQSAGGYLAAMAGTTNGDRRFDIGDHLDRSSEVQAVVDEFGASDLARVADDFDAATRKTYNAPGSFINAYVFGPGSRRTVVGDPAARAASDPASHIDARTAPFILLQGDDDRIVSPSQSLILADALKAAGTDATRYVIKGAGHGDMAFLGDPDAGAPWSTRKVMDTITGFLDARLGGAR
ncbi:alpha/beta fold hydrolase [Streptomyces sp. NPDC015171]|uniref:alpha/beta fold hydrolase n=1 Tax=Streptomyces sp. NPDC015171 TaxID=3364945 RepID=UPI003700297F